VEGLEVSFRTFNSNQKDFTLVANAITPLFENEGFGASEYLYMANNRIKGEYFTCKTGETLDDSTRIGLKDVSGRLLSKAMGDSECTEFREVETIMRVFQKLFHLCTCREINIEINYNRKFSSRNIIKYDSPLTMLTDFD